MTPETMIIIQGILTGLTAVCGIIAFLSFVTLCYQIDFDKSIIRVLFISLAISLLGAGLGGGGAWGLWKARTGACADRTDTGAEND